MDNSMKSITHFENEYSKYGLAAQRMYPNEAMCRFLGGNGYFSRSDKKNIRILEVGCGSGGNLWMIAKEGFDTYGLDSSKTAVDLCKWHISEKWGGCADVRIGTFEDLPYEDEFFDVVIDVVSLQHLDLDASKQALSEICRVMKKDAKFFSYRLSDGSCMYMNSGGEFEDAATVDNIVREEMPLHHNQRISFWSPSIARMYYDDSGLQIRSIEKDTRTYQNMKMMVEYLAIVATKKDLFE